MILILLRQRVFISNGYAMGTAHTCAALNMYKHLMLMLCICAVAVNYRSLQHSMALFVCHSFQADTTNHVGMLGKSSRKLCLSDIGAV